MNIESKQICSISELREYYTELFNEEMNHEGAFLQAYQNGQYKNKSGLWTWLAGEMTDEMIIESAQYVIRALIDGSGETREGPNLKLLMDFHEALIHWSEKRSQTPNELLEYAEKIKDLLMNTRPGDKPWFIDILRHHSLFHMAILKRTRSSILDLETDYDRLIEKSLK